DVSNTVAPDGDGFLAHPCAVLRGNSVLDRRGPGGFTGFPAESHTGTAVLIAGFQHQVLTLSTDKRKQIDVLAVVRRPDIRDNARPRNMISNELAFAVGEERTVLLVGQHSEKRLYMRNLAAK